MTDYDLFEIECALQEAAFVHGAQACREMMARFIEQGGTETECAIAESVRLNWHPGWGLDPGPLTGSIPYNSFGESAETDELLTALAAATGTAKTAKQAECEASQSGGSASERNAQTQSSTPDNKDKPNA